MEVPFILGCGESRVCLGFIGIRRVDLRFTGFGVSQGFSHSGSSHIGLCSSIGSLAWASQGENLGSRVEVPFAS